MKRVLISMLATGLIFLLTTSVGAANQAARLRIIHTVPDAPTVNVLVNGKLAFSQVAFADISDYLEFKERVYSVSFVSATTPSIPIFETAVGLQAGRNYTLAITGKLALIETLLLDDPTDLSATGQPQIRFVNLSANAPAFNVLAKNGIEAALFKEVSFMNTPVYVPLKAGRYDISLEVAQTERVTLQAPRLTFESGHHYTIFAVGLFASQPELQLLTQADTFSIDSIASEGRQSLASTSDSVTLDKTAQANTAMKQPLTQPQPTLKADTQVNQPVPDQAVAASTSETVAGREASQDSSQTVSSPPSLEEITTKIAQVTVALQDEGQLPVGQPVALSLAHRTALDNIDLSVEQLLIPDNAAPQVMPETGFEDIYGLFTEDEAAAPETITATPATHSSWGAMPLLLASLMVGGGFLGLRGAWNHRRLVQKRQARRRQPTELPPS